MKNLLIFIFLIGFAIACDTVSYKDAIVKPEVVPVDTTPVLDTLPVIDTTISKDTTPVKEPEIPKDSIYPIDYENRVFLEDYTGHTCGNCPYAAQEIKKLETQYGKKIVAMAIHVGNFAAPSLNPNKTSFKTDFRTAVGNLLDDKFKATNAGLPKGTINRKKFTSSTSVSLLNYSEWNQRVASLLGGTGFEIGLKIVPTYNTSNRAIQLNVNTKFKKGFQGQVRTQAYIIEDSIVNWQLFYPTPSTKQEIENYVHMHMLRSELSPKTGNYNLSSGTSISSGQGFKMEWQGVLPGSVNPEKAKIIFVLTNVDSEEVLQVAEVDLVAQ